MLGQKIASPAQGIGESLVPCHKQREQVIHDLPWAQPMSLLIAGSNQHRHNISRIAPLALVTCNDLFQSRSDQSDGLANTASIANTRDIKRKMGKGDAKGVVHGVGHHGHGITKGLLGSAEVPTE